MAVERRKVRIKPESSENSCQSCFREHLIIILLNDFNATVPKLDSSIWTQPIKQIWPNFMKQLIMSNLLHSQSLTLRSHIC